MQSPSVSFLEILYIKYLKGEMLNVSWLVIVRKHFRNICLRIIIFHAYQ